MTTKNLRTMLAFVLMLGAIMLAGCGGGGGSASGTPVAPVVNPSAKAVLTPDRVILSSSATSIKADGSNFTTLTASIVDANNFAVSGQTVSFTITTGSGQLGVVSGTSSDAGQVSITYTAKSPSGPLNSTDRTDVVKATVVGTSVSDTIPIPVTASSLSLILGASPASIKKDNSNWTTITAKVTDAGGNISAASTGMWP